MMITLAGSVLMAPNQASAISGSEFNPANIIDDGVFFNKDTMNTGDIQNFLNSKVASCRAGYTCLKNYSQGFGSIGADAYCGGISGGTKSAANILFDVSQACGINPQTLIVMLQKEQGLVTDDWPTDNQYRIAMGYACPDTAPCDSQYYGFFNQVYNAARQMKRYGAQPQLFNYAAGRTSFVQWHPNAGCGGTNIGIQNRATAALYNYTPYQPNAAALNNLYGLGDGCSAYGNRNFWRMFSDWFGATRGDGFVLALNQDDNSQWVIYRNIKQYVPSAEIKHAWGLPDEATPMSGHYLSGIPEGPHLGRMFQLIGDPTLYFADGGKRYRVPSIQMRDTWGFNGQVISSVSRDLWLLPQTGGDLTYAVKSDDSPALYMIDGLNGSNQMILRQYLYPDTHKTWEGDHAPYTTISDDYWGTIDNAIGSSLSGYTIKGSGPTQYHIIAGQKLYLSGEMAAVYNQSYNQVSEATLSRLVTSSPVTNFVRLPGNGVTIYMIDNGNKRAVNSVEVLRAWSPNNSPNVNILNQGFLDSLGNGASVGSYLADVSGQLYIIDGRKITVPSGLDSAYRTGTVTSINSSLLGVLPDGGNATNFIKGEGPSVYLMDQGTMRHISSGTAWQLWNGNRGEALVSVIEPVLSQFSHGGQIQHYFSVGGTNYAIDNGTYHSVATDVATDWGLSGPVAINSATRDRFTSGAALTQKTQVGSNYFRVKYGKKHITPDTTVAALWGVSSSPVSVTNTLMDTVNSGPTLSIFAKSTDNNDHRIFLVDNSATSFYHLTSVEQFLSYGYGGGDIITAVQPADLGTPGTAKNIIKTSTNDTERVIDGGQKHPFTSSTVRDRWVTGSNTLTVSNTLWGYFSVGSNYSGNVKASAPNVYNIDAGQKRWIQSQSAYQTYTSQYGAHTNISDWLASLLPNGSNLE